MNPLLPILVYPTQESYTIGDDIWFEMNFPDIFNALQGLSNKVVTRYYERNQLYTRYTWLQFVIKSKV